MKDGTVIQVKARVTAPERTAQEGKWVLGGGNELSCRFYLFASEEHKNKIRDAIRALFARS